MNALLQTALHWEACSVGDVDALLTIEQRVYSHPWTRGNFIDSLASKHWAWKGSAGGELRAYWLAMPVLDEVHLLNLAVHPDHWGQGLARDAMAHLLDSARQQGFADVYLEVRASNHRAQHLYARSGFRNVGLRRAYYPADGNIREDAVLMRLDLGQAT
jgi:ribosomal-protein-alanine N-acetyltransferase